MHKALSLIVLSLLLASPVFALDPKEPATSAAVANNASNPCKEYVAKFCPNVTPGNGQIIPCLESNLDKISPACRKQIEDVKKGFRPGKANPGGAR